MGTSPPPAHGSRQTGRMQMKQDTIYQKTLQGIHEINHRSAEINARLRRLLLMIDGRKTQRELQQLTQIDDLASALQQLRELHLIEPHETTLADLLVASAR